MTIKKLFLALSSVLCFSNAFAYDGTITIQGRVTNQTCSVMAGSDDLTVTLPTVGVNAFNSAGQGGRVAGRTPFAIELQGCNVAAGSYVSAYFEPSDGVTNNLLNNTAAAEAVANVRVQLLNSQFQPILLSNGTASTQNSTKVEVNSATPVLNYFAQYYADGQVNPGEVHAQVHYTIVYN